MSKTNDPIDVLIEYQQWRGGVAHDGAGEEESSGVHGWPALTGYDKDTMRKLLKDNLDYQHGPIKRYKDNES